MADQQPALYPWVILVLFELLYNLSCFPTTLPYTRKWILGPIMLAIAAYLWRQPYQLVGSPSLAYAFGFRLSFQSFSLVNFIYIHSNFPNFWRRKRDGDELPSEFDLGKKLSWMSDLSNATRRVGWVQEPTSAIPPRPRFSSRIAFIRSRLFYGLFYLIAWKLSAMQQKGNPAFDQLVHAATDGPETYIRGQPPFQRILDFASWGVTLMSSMSLAHVALSVMSVGLSQSDPDDWPAMYGSFARAYSLRNFWGKTWHQTLRATITGFGKHIAHTTFGFAPGTKSSSYIQLYVAFLLSGLIHAGGDYMVLKRLSSAPTSFFLLQAAAITIEDFVIWLARPLHERFGWIGRGIGYFWVALWLCSTAPLWIDKMSVEGYQTNDIGIAFEPLREAWRN